MTQYELETATKAYEVCFRRKFALRNMAADLGRVEKRTSCSKSRNRAQTIQECAQYETMQGQRLDRELQGSQIDAMDVHFDIEIQCETNLHSWKFQDLNCPIARFWQGFDWRCRSSASSSLERPKWVGCNIHGTSSYKGDYEWT